LSAPLAILLAVVALAIGLALGYLIASLRASREKHALQISLESERVRREAEAQTERETAAALQQSEERLRGAFDTLAGWLANRFARTAKCSCASRAKP
jgi:hypothetical protein